MISKQIFKALGRSVWSPTCRKSLISIEQSQQKICSRFGSNTSSTTVLTSGTANKINSPVLTANVCQYNPSLNAFHLRSHNIHTDHKETEKQHFDIADGKHLIDSSCSETKEVMFKDMLIYPDFITEEEEQSLMNETEPYLKRMHYEFDHWDDAIVGFRETEKKKWKAPNKVILKRLKETAFPPDTKLLPLVHVLDLEKSGCIKPHIDAVRFCGRIIAGISLLSSSVMRLTHDKDETKMADILLQRRSLYVMKWEPYSMSSLLSPTSFNGYSLSVCYLGCC